ncbi:beta-phosphoglucomutase [Providencia sp. PROV152]|uniref:Beta-phosphoglucomutase n=2 Tax=Providencia TaxID=586 RepID=A0AAI9I155_PROST|nr:beta-phosphoglucomutase [Providencia sp. PROV152]ELR5036363.1 beta-phosphoglucomutase [Providencia stuartii]
MVKGLIFDLDGVIVDTAGYHYLAWKKLANEIGIEINEEFNQTLKGISRTESLDKILNYGNKQNLFSAQEKSELSERKNNYYVKLLDNITPKDILPGVLELIEQAYQYNIPCVIASASQNAPMILKKLNIDNYFQAIVDPKSLAKGKPDPEIFLKAAQLIHVPVEFCVGFEDSIAGIQSLKKAGIYAIGIIAEGLLPEADLEVNSLTEIDIHTLLQ